jgi:hypothetical protein
MRVAVSQGELLWGKRVAELKIEQLSLKNLGAGFHRPLATHSSGFLLVRGNSQRLNRSLHWLMIWAAT